METLLCKRKELCSAQTRPSATPYNPQHRRATWGMHRGPLSLSRVARAGTRGSWTPRSDALLGKTRSAWEDTCGVGTVPNGVCVSGYNSASSCIPRPEGRQGRTPKKVQGNHVETSTEVLGQRRCMKT